AYSTLNRLGYTFNKNINVKYINPDENGNYTINADDSQDSILLLPISLGTVEINGNSAESYKLTDELPLDYGKNTFSIMINTENAEPNTINLTVYRGDYENIPGDVNGDGVVNSSDASDILAEYALVSSGEPETFSDIQKISADFNNDGFINSSDASEILAYYAEISSGK
ncbi:MAG: dockerin type I domain-containing protein, partial [Ruminococcus sp.]